MDFPKGTAHLEILSALFHTAFSHIAFHKMSMECIRNLKRICFFLKKNIKNGIKQNNSKSWWVNHYHADIISFRDFFFWWNIKSTMIKNYQNSFLFLNSFFILRSLRMISMIFSQIKLSKYISRNLHCLYTEKIPNKYSRIKLSREWILCVSSLYEVFHWNIRINVINSQARFGFFFVLLNIH